MSDELTKREKKAARAMIEKGLRKEMEGCLQELEAILADRRTNNKDVKETYYPLYKSLTDFDKHIAFRYNGIRGSHYLTIMIGQLRDGVGDRPE